MTGELNVHDRTLYPIPGAPRLPLRRDAPRERSLLLPRLTLPLARSTRRVSTLPLSTHPFSAARAARSRRRSRSGPCSSRPCVSSRRRQAPMGSSGACRTSTENSASASVTASVATHSPTMRASSTSRLVWTRAAGVVPHHANPPEFQPRLRRDGGALQPLLPARVRAFSHLLRFPRGLWHDATPGIKGGWLVFSPSPPSSPALWCTG